MEGRGEGTCCCEYPAGEVGTYEVGSNPRDCTSTPASAWEGGACWYDDEGDSGFRAMLCCRAGGEKDGPAAPGEVVPGRLCSSSGFAIRKPPSDCERLRSPFIVSPKLVAPAERVRPRPYNANREIGENLKPREGAE